MMLMKKEQTDAWYVASFSAFITNRPCIATNIMHATEKLA